MSKPRGIIVNQTDARQRGGHRAPLAVGVCRWRGADDWLSVIAKMSLSIVEDEVEVIDPQPVCREHSDQRPTDFVPYKPRCDVLVVGHAHAQEPAERVEVVLRLDDFTRRLEALAADPALSIPLTANHLRDEHGEPCHLGPNPITREEEGDGFETYDKVRFQSAAVASRSGYLPAGAELTLVGLSPRAERRTLRFPKLAPFVWFERHTELIRLDTYCDTVFLDTDFERIDLVWRALIPPQNRRIERLVVSLEDLSHANRDLEAVGRELPRGTVCWAAEEVETEAHDEELEMASYEVLEHAAEPEMTLEEYAGASAKVAEQDRPREEILDDLDLDERSWGIEERAWVERMGKEAEAGDGRLAAAFAERFLAAQDELKKPHEPKPMETYVTVKAELERANKPKDVLERHDLCFGEWMRLERHWADEAAKDPDVMKELEAMLTSARKQVRS